MFEIVPVYRAMKGKRRAYRITDDMRQSEAIRVHTEAVEYAEYLSNSGVPFIVRESDNVTSGKVWLSKNAN